MSPSELAAELARKRRRASEGMTAERIREQLLRHAALPAVLSVGLTLAACSTPPESSEIRPISLSPLAAPVARADGKAVVILSRAERQRRLLEEARGLLR